MTKTKGRTRVLSLLLAVLMLVSSLPLTASAASIADGSTSCNVALGPGHFYLQTTAGTSLGAWAYTYTTNDGTTGPAFCINHGLHYTSRTLPIAGKYTASPKAAGALANGYPSHSVDTFLGLYLASNPILSGLTETELAYATQLAIWASLGQLGIAGTEFTAGREFIAEPTSDTQQMRVFRAVQLILNIANTWTLVPSTGMYIRKEEDSLGGNISVPADMTLEYAADNEHFGIKREVIGGVSYYTREYIFASATSTYYSGYNIELWADNAPAGTIFTDTGNNELSRGTFQGNATWRLPVEKKDTALNSNGNEYSGRAKLCIPVETAPNSGEITIRCGANVMQYEIYLAKNDNAAEQSYVIADPSEGVQRAEAVLMWGGILTETGKLRVTKVSGGGLPLSGAKFELSGTDGTTRTGITDESGVVQWDALDPLYSYTLTETQAPAGYAVVDPINIHIEAARTNFITVQDTTEKQLTVKKVDKQTGYSLQGAVMKFEQIDGSFETTAVTDQAGIIQLNADQLPVGSYQVYEVTPPSGYELDATPQTVHWDGLRDVTLTFNNVRKHTLIIYKCDAGNNYSLPYATFEVYKNGQLVTTVTTNQAGLAYVPDVTTGYYTVKETAAPSGYVLDSSEHSVYVDNYDPATTDDPRIAIENSAKPMLRIVKYDAQTKQPLSDTTFAVYRDTELIGEYTTQANGEVLLTGLTPGTYLVKEIATKNSHVVNSSPQEIKLEAGTQDYELVFLNDLKPGIHAVKLDSQTMLPLSGAKFRVTQIGGDYKNEFVSDSNGEIDLTALDPGSYTVEELTAPVGYLIDAAQRVIRIEGGENAEFVFTDTKKPDLKIVKTDAITGKPVSGVTITVKKADSSTLLTGTTDRGGEILLEQLDPGVYEVWEQSVPDEYLIDEAHQSITLVPGKTGVVQFQNYPKGTLVVQKIDSATGAPLTGAEFKITAANGELTADNEGLTSSNGLYTVDRNGQIVLEKLDPGVYVVTETKAPDGYVLEAQPQTVVVNAGDTQTLTFGNPPKGSLTVHKLDSITRQPLQGVQFKITYADGKAVDQGELSTNGLYTTDKNGQITLTNITGTLIVTEVQTISGYVIDPETRSQTVAVNPDDAQALTFYNQPKGTLIVRKFDKVTNQPLSGAQFKITTSTGELLASNEGLTSSNGLYVTDENGQIVLEKLSPATYIVTETQAPEGYALDSQTQSVVVNTGDAQTVSFYDEPLATLTLLKRDAVSKLPLANAEFTVKTADGTAIGTNNGLYTTDDTGTATVTGIEPNTAVVVSEDSAPAGYVANATPKTIVVKSGVANMLTFDDEPTTTLIIHKYIDGTNNEPLSGIGFRVTDSTGAAVGPNNGTYYTDRAGEIMLTGIAPGRSVTAQEFQTVDGFVLDGTPQTVQIKDYQKMELTFWNQRQGTLKIKKLDSETRKPIAGTEFKVTYADGRTADTAGGKLSSNGQYFTDANGEITITNVTGTFVVTEVTPAPGYSIDPDQRTQTVVVNPNDTQTLTFFNTPTQSLVIQKYVAGTTTPIEGCKFLVSYSSGTLIGPANGEYVTDRNGRITISGLEAGATVKVKEIQTTADYVLDSTVQSIAIREGEVQTLTFYNQPKGSLIVRKLDGANQTPLSGAEFKITTAAGEPVTGFAGGTGEDGFYATDRTGQITLAKLNPGTYIVTETKAPEGYVLNGKPQTVVLGAAETKTVTAENLPKGNLIIQKYDSVTKKALAGAEFKVTTASGEPVADHGGKVTMGGSFVTDSNGQITLAKLDPGVYLVTETKAPENYHLNSTAQTVEVLANDTQRLSFYNDPLATLTVTKVDAVSKKPLANATFTVADSEGTAIGGNNGLYTTGTDGTFTVSGIAPDTTLVVTEQQASSEYVREALPQTIKVKSGVTNSLIFEDQPTATLVVHKYIDGTENEPLSGVGFKVTDGSGKAIGPDDGVYYTDHAGEIRLSGLEPGITVKAREIKTVEGFVLDGTPQDVVMQAGAEQTLTFWNKRQGALTIRKLDSATQQPLEGVTFKITDATGAYVPDKNGKVSSNGLYKTDAAGEIVLTGVSGTLVVTEVETISGYTIREATRSQTVVVRPDDVQTLTFYNDPTQTLTINKYIADTTTPIEGVTFKVTSSDGAVIGSNNGEFVTDRSGQITITGLVPGTTVTAKEVKTVSGFVLNSTPQSILIKSGEAQALNFYNQRKGTLIVEKRDSVTGAPLSGAEFKITTLDGAYVDDNEGRTSTKGIYKTDENGRITLTNLLPDSYVVTETKAPEGYILDGEAQTVKVNANDTQTITFTNTAKQSVVIQKYIDGTTKPLAGVTFLVTDASGVPVGSANGEHVTDENGRIVLTGLTPGMTLIAREVRTVKGYTLNGNPQTIVVGTGAASQTVTAAPSNGTAATGTGNTLTFYDEPLSVLIIQKYVEGTTTPIKGVRFLVTDNRGAAVGTTDGEYVTDEHGQIVLRDLEPGAVITAKEVKAADGYVANSDPKSITIQSGDVQTLTFVRFVP